MVVPERTGIALPTLMRYASVCYYKTYTISRGSSSEGFCWLYALFHLRQLCDRLRARMVRVELKLRAFGAVDGLLTSLVAAFRLLYEQSM